MRGLIIDERSFNNTCHLFQIVVQVMVSLMVITYSLIQVMGNFKEIRATVDMQNKSWDTLGNFPSFYIFNHRGKALSPDYEAPTRLDSDHRLTNSSNVAT